MCQEKTPLVAPEQESADDAESYVSFDDFPENKETNPFALAAFIFPWPLGFAIDIASHAIMPGVFSGIALAGGLLIMAGKREEDKKNQQELNGTGMSNYGTISTEEVKTFDV